MTMTVASPRKQQRQLANCFAAVLNKTAMHRIPARAWLSALFQLWLAHAVAYLAHEYAHSFTAFFLHAKVNPFALDYGGVNLDNLLFLSDIDENVNYAPLFAAGRNHAAALIAVSGVLIGNGLSYSAGLLLYRRASAGHRRRPAMFSFWLVAMSVGNFLSYVPVRTFASHADMFTVERGLRVSPWAVALGLGTPFLFAVGHFLWSMLPKARTFLLGTEPVLQGVLVIVTTYLIFVFFGGVGLTNYGSASRWISACCEYLLFPLATVFCLQNPRGLDMKPIQESR